MAAPGARILCAVYDCRSSELSLAACGPHYVSARKEYACTLAAADPCELQCEVLGVADQIRANTVRLACGRLNLLLWSVRVCAFARSLAHAPWLNRTELLPRVHDALPTVWLGQNRRLR